MMIGPVVEQPTAHYIYTFVVANIEIKEELKKWSLLIFILHILCKMQTGPEL